MENWVIFRDEHSFFSHDFYSYPYINSFLYIYSFQHIEEKTFRKTLWKKVKLLKMSNFTFFHNVFYTTCILQEDHDGPISLTWVYL